MQYFVTGATGFIGRRLVQALLARRGSTVYFLLRPGSEHKLAGLRAFWRASPARAVPVSGDLTARGLGVPAETVAALKGRIDAVFHLGAVYDLAADAQAQSTEPVAPAGALGAGCSSTPVQRIWPSAPRSSVRRRTWAPVQTCRLGRPTTGRRKALVAFQRMPRFWFTSK